MRLFFAVLRFLGWIVGIYIALNLLFLGVFIFSPSFSGNDLVLERILFGFAAFLKNNLPAISWNAATWGPGLGAFLIATAFLHRWLSRWAKRTGRPWSFATSSCLALLVPVLFVISFIVPGVLLQWEALRETVWISVR